MRLFLICALFPLMAVAPPAYAQEESEEAAAEDSAAQDDEEILETVPVDEGTESAPPPEDDDGAVSYSGIGLSRVKADFDNLKEAVNLDFALGIRIPTINFISAEIGFSTTIIPGENEGGQGGGFGGGGCGGVLQPSCPEGSQGRVTQTNDDLQMNNIGVFAVVRSPGRFYALGKLGYRYINTNIQEIQEGERSGTAYALGGGYRWGTGLSGVELIYMDYSEDLEYIGFNVAYGFGGLR